MNNLLSIIVPVSNMAGRLDLLRQWIDDISFSKIEIILVHDIKDERTGIELEDLVKNKNKQIKLIEGYFGDPGSSRNAGLEVCKAEWIIFCDSDDRPRIDNIISGILGSHNLTNFIVGNFVTINNQHYRKHVISREKFIDNMTDYPGLWRIVFRKSRIDNYIFPSIRMAEDQVFIANLGIEIEENQS